jgi:thiamine biosynthesis lipoprotein
LFFLAASAMPAAGAEMLRLEQSVEAMGSTYSVAVYGEDRTLLETAVTAAFDEARRLDDLLSNYKRDSAWSEMNREAAERPVRVPREMFDLLSACQQYSRQSEGAFDISVGPLMKIWGFYKGSGRLPHRGEILAALRRVGYQHVKLDPAELTVRFDRRGVELDPGGIGKGYTVDRMVEVLKEKAVEVALVSAAGSTIYGLGAPPNEPRGWRILIRDPKDNRRTAAEVFLKNESMSTSGNYEKFFRAEGKVYSHIMDPRTGYPAEGMLSVSVMAPRALDSEAWTKPLFIHGRRWAAQHKPEGFRAFLCESTRGATRGPARRTPRSETPGRAPAVSEPEGSSSNDRTNQPCAWLP